MFSHSHRERKWYISEIEREREREGGEKERRRAGGGQWVTYRKREGPGKEKASCVAHCFCGGHRESAWLI